MNPVPPPESDPALRGLLQDALPDPALPPGFESGVWRRIERDEAAALSLVPLLGAVLARLFRPAWAMTGLTAALLLGLGLGWQPPGAGRLGMERDRYLATVSPWHRVP